MPPLPQISALLDRSLSSATSYIACLSRGESLIESLASLTSQLDDVLHFSVSGSEPTYSEARLPTLLSEFPDLSERIAVKLSERIEQLLGQLRFLALGKEAGLGVLDTSLSSSNDATTIPSERDSDDDGLSFTTANDASPRSSKKSKKKSSGQRSQQTDFPSLLAALVSQKAHLGRLSGLPGALATRESYDTFGISGKEAMDWISELIEVCEEGILKRTELVRELRLSLPSRGDGMGQKSQKGTLDDVESEWEDNVVSEVVAKVKERLALAKAVKEAG